MNITVYLIDDNDTPKIGKFANLEKFVTFLNATFAPVTFVEGQMLFRGKLKPLTSAFAKDATQIDRVLHDGSSLILLDITMSAAPYVAAAEALLKLHPEAVKRATEISTILENGNPSENTKLAGTIVAIAEKALTRIVWVSTESPGEITVNLNGLEVGWIPWASANWASVPLVITHLRTLIERGYMEEVYSLRDSWNCMGNSAR